MPTTISEFLLQNKKLLIIEALLLLLIPLLWSFGDKILDVQDKIEISKVLLAQLIATLSILSIALFVACLSLSGKIREQNNNIEHRRNLIVSWRKMVKEVIKEHDKTNTSISNLIERHESYYSLRSHLSQKTIGEIARIRTFIAGSTIGSPLEFVLDDIARIEKEWHLI